MRLGVVYEPGSNAIYRAIAPARAMERRGHVLVWGQDANGRINPRELAGCDVVHLYRSWSPAVHQALKNLAAQGCAIVYDNDDDFTAVPEESPHYKVAGGLAGQRAFVDSVKVARLARVMTTTSEAIAARYREAGVERVEVLDNQLTSSAQRRRVKHDGVVIGWVAALEHVADARRIGIRDALEKVLAKHPKARVECIGVDLKLGDRYRHDGIVPFEKLPGRMAAWDIGIAPLADIPYNRARSAIKLKEYAACRVPWLASPVGPYVGLGKDQGGRLVEDGRWFEELDRLVSKRFARWMLGIRGATWAKTQTIDAVADRWEHVFTTAAAAR